MVTHLEKEKKYGHSLDNYYIKRKKSARSGHTLNNNEMEKMANLDSNQAVRDWDQRALPLHQSFSFAGWG